MIDIHCHLLPEIDDGPQSQAEALVLANMAVKNGITKAVVTPHIHPGRYENDKSNITNCFNDFKELLQNCGVKLELGMAAEVRVCPEIIPLIAQHKIPFLGQYEGFEIILLEFPHSHIPPGSDKLVKYLLKEGIRPLIAHPERNKEVMKDLSKLTPFKELDCLFQVTAGSVAGKFGEICQEISKELILRKWVTVIASDAHNETHRPPDVMQGYKHASLLMGSEYAEDMVLNNPMEITRKQFQDLAITDETSQHSIELPVL